MTSFSETADALLANGYSIIPIIPGEKRPGTYAGSTWYGMKDWTRFCDKVVTKFELDLWKQWPEPSICVALGRASNLTAIDYDYGEGEMQRELEALLPISPVQKKGAKGRTDFFRAFSHASRKHLLDGVSVVELLAHGKQTVLPPSRHPDGMNYHWLTEKTLLNTTVDELPVIPADYHIRVIEIITRYQKTVPKVEYVKSDRQLKGEMDPDSYWFKLNRFALDNLAIWVPKLDPSAGRGAKGASMSAPAWLQKWRYRARWSCALFPSGIPSYYDTRHPIGTGWKAAGSWRTRACARCCRELHPCASGAGAGSASPSWECWHGVGRGLARHSGRCYSPGAG